MSLKWNEIPHVQKISRAEHSMHGRRLPLPNLGLRFSERKLLLALVDLLAINGALFVYLLIRSYTDHIPANFWGEWHWFASLSGLWLLVGILLDIYDLPRAANVMDSLWGAGGAALAAGSIYLFIPYVTPVFPGRRLEALLCPILAAVSVGTWRILYAEVFVQPVFHQRALVVGAGWSGRTLAQTIASLGRSNRDPYHGAGYRLLGFIDDDDAKQETEVEGVPVLGTRGDLVRLAQELRPHELIIAITKSQIIHGELFQAILDCREMGISITTMATLYERLTGRVPVEHAGRDLYVVLPLSQSGTHRFFLLFQRSLDILVSLFGCVVLALVIPFVWLANRVSSPGPLFYRQTRVGKSGHNFTLIKFRSMIVDAEKHTGAVWARESDSRITPVGRILRKTRLDEVPQFWNVLKGEMSLVGPRPERPEFVNRLAQKIPFYRVRHAVKPGLTGWAQVEYRYGASVDDALVKLQYDLYYIKHQGLYLDLLTLLRTIQVILGFKGR